MGVRAKSNVPVGKAIAIFEGLLCPGDDGRKCLRRPSGSSLALDMSVQVVSDYCIPEDPRWNTPDLQGINGIVYWIDPTKPRPTELATPTAPAGPPYGPTELATHPPGPKNLKIILRILWVAL